MNAVPQPVRKLNDERQHLVQRLQQSRDRLLDSVAELPERLCRVRPFENTWSAIDCVEHIVIAEKAWHVRLQSRRRVNAPVDRAKDDFVNGVADRSEKRSAPERAQPKGKYATLKEAVDEFRTTRNQTIDFALHTDEDFREFSVEHALGVFDIHQYLLLAAAHAEGHAKQIDEIKASAAYRAALHQQTNPCLT